MASRLNFFSKTLNYAAMLPFLIVGFWIERNCALPWIPTELGWPWVVVDGSLRDQLLWDSVGVSAFACAAYFVFCTQLSSVVFLRLFLGIFGVFLISLWQSTGIVLYQLIPHGLLSSMVSFFIFWAMITALFRPWPFKQKSCLLLALVFLTPMMTLDRVLIGVGVIIYLALSFRTLQSQRLALQSS